MVTHQQAGLDLAAPMRDIRGMILLGEPSQGTKRRVATVPGREPHMLLKPLGTRTAPVSVLVSFAAVRERPQRTGAGRSSRSQTTLAHRERTPADLESVLGATPQEFESLILRHREQQRRSRAGLARLVSHTRGLSSGLI